MPTTHDVVITEDHEYSPETITIIAGDSVRWTNQDATRHNAYSTRPPVFKTEMLSRGQSATVTFSEPTGANPVQYGCTPHPHMKGFLVVKAQ